MQSDTHIKKINIDRLGDSREYKVHSFYRSATDKASWKANNGIQMTYRL